MAQLIKFPQADKISQCVPEGYIEILICEPRGLCQIPEFSYFSEQKFGNGMTKCLMAKITLEQNQPKNQPQKQKKREILTHSKHFNSLLQSSKHHNTSYVTVIPSTLLYYFTQN